MSSRTSQWRNVNRALIDAVTGCDGIDHHQCNNDKMDNNEMNSNDQVDNNDEIDHDFEINVSNSLSNSDSESDSESDSQFDNLLDTEITHQENEATLKGNLAEWVVKNQTSHSATNELLEILRSFGHEELPKDVRTLLKTPRHIAVKEKCGGEYIYFGLETCILKHLGETQTIDSVDLFVNIDGLPIFKSTSADVWPILCCFSNVQPFVVALFCGISSLYDHH